jgi:hypothetical protein
MASTRRGCTNNTVRPEVENGTGEPVGDGAWHVGDLSKLYRAES